MCVIAVAGLDKKVTDSEFKNCFYSNPDGFGMMWVENGEIKTYKTLVLESALREYNIVFDRIGSTSPIVLHFRIGTQGPNDLTNCHPFKVSNKVSFCHNGIISQWSRSYYSTSVPAKDDNRSDTRLFNDNVLKLLPVDFIKNETTRKFIEEYVSTDKLVFLDTLDSVPSVTIINESYGERNKNDIWFSNKSYVGYTYKKPKGTLNKFKKVYCEHCGKQCFTSHEVGMGICYKCSPKVCPVCGEYSDDIVTVSYKGHSHKFCSECFDLTDKNLYGVFDSVLDSTPVIGNWYSETLNGVDYLFVVSDVTKYKVELTAVESETLEELNVKYTMAIDIFNKRFKFFCEA